MIERYTRPEMGAVWSEQRKLERWLEVELAALDAWADVGRVPHGAADAIRSALQADGWTVNTADGKLAAHFEHTIAITEDGPQILTIP